VYYAIYLKEWNEDDSTWFYIAPVNIPLQSGKGYAAWASNGLTGTKTVEFKGTLHNSDVSPVIGYTPGVYVSSPGFNLIGNPFPSDIEWKSTWAKSKVDPAIYIFDGVQYLTWNYNIDGFGTKGNGIIANTQGFLIHANRVLSGSFNKGYFTNRIKKKIVFLFKYFFPAVYSIAGFFYDE